MIKYGVIESFTDDEQTTNELIYIAETKEEAENKIESYKSLDMFIEYQSKECSKCNIHKQRDCHRKNITKINDEEDCENKIVRYFDYSYDIIELNFEDDIVDMNSLEELFKATNV